MTRTRTRLLRGGERAAREKRCREPCSLPVGRTAAALTPAAASRRRRRARGAAASERGSGEGVGAVPPAELALVARATGGDGVGGEGARPAGWIR